MLPATPARRPRMRGRSTRWRRRRRSTAVRPIRASSAAASFAFSADEAAGFECRLDAGDWAACESPQAYADLADGAHSFEVRATDAAGNTGASAGHAWRIDTVAPTTTIVAGPADPSNSAAASFEFTADESVAFECRLDAGDWAACESPQAYADLADGEHSFEVRATDAAGNTGDVAVYAWTVDTVAPTAKVDSGPADPSKSSAGKLRLQRRRGSRVRVPARRRRLGCL